MIDPWFPREMAPALSFLALCAVLGGLESYAKKGQHRALVTSAFSICAAMGAVLLSIAVIAVFLDQPRHVVFPLSWAGIVFLFAFGWALHKSRKQYAEADLRKIDAYDL